MIVNTAQRLTGHVNAGDESSQRLTGHVNAGGRSPQPVNGQANVSTVLKGDPGDPGAVFTPIIDADGNLSWTNDGGLTNPDTINIKGPKGDPGRTIQSDWNQTDASQPDYIKNKPEDVTDEDIVDILMETDMLPAVTDADGAILADENGNILLW